MSKFFFFQILKIKHLCEINHERSKKKRCLIHNANIFTKVYKQTTRCVRENIHDSSEGFIN